MHNSFWHAIEAEITQLTSQEEKNEFLTTLGLKEAGLNKLIRAGYNLLDLITFFTAGPKEARAWTLPKVPLLLKEQAVFTPILKEDLLEPKRLAMTTILPTAEKMVLKMRVD